MSSLLNFMLDDDILTSRRHSHSDRSHVKVEQEFYVPLQRETSSFLVSLAYR